MYDRIPEPTVRRLSAYLRTCEQLVAAGQQSVSSGQLAESISAGADMVRRDLSMFGQFGQRGRGYDVAELTTALRMILGTTRDWPMVLVGVGNLGRALMEYPDFARRGFRIVAAFDNDPDKVGRAYGGVGVQNPDQLEDTIARCGARLAVLSVPPSVAEPMARRLGAAGIQGILNFATQMVQPIDGVFIDNVDISSYLEHLSFQVSGLRP